MFDYTGQIVQATAGRDKGGVFCVVGMDHRQERLLLADGKRRKVSRPKAKSWAIYGSWPGPGRSMTTRPSRS
ncbi:MAG: KOW domain-containing RNA-binding protein [Lawsonibacter sp.]